MEKIRLRARGTTAPGETFSDWEDDQWTCPCGCIVYGKNRCCGRIQTSEAFAETMESKR